MFKQYLLASAIALATVNPAVAASSPFGQLVVFGDSLLDTGNFGVRFTNKDSDGSGNDADISADILADYLGVELTPAILGGTNYAVGGYQTSDIFNSVAGTGIETFLGSRNAYLAEVGGSISADTLIFMDGGGNDISAILQTVAPADVPAAVQASAQTYVSTAAALHRAGAQYIMLANVPDVGKTPFAYAAETFGVLPPGTSATISAITSGMNDGIDLLSALLLSDANIIPVDIAGLGDFIIANADAYGIANGLLDVGGGLMLEQSLLCYDGSGGSCIEHPLYGLNSIATSGDSADPRKLFFNDALHPTELVSEINGDYVIDILSAPMEVGLLPELALSASRAQGAAAINELRNSRWNEGQGRLFFSGDINEDDSSNFGGNDGKSVTVGMTYAASTNLMVGLAITVGNQEVELTGTSFESDSLGLTAMLGYRRDKIFIDGLIGLSDLTYDNLMRDVELGTITLEAEGDTNGLAWNLDVLVGYDVLSSDKWHLAPAVGFQVIDVHVDGYTESGGGVSNYRWFDQDRKSQQYRVGLVMSGDLNKRLSVFAEVFAVTEDKHGDQDIRIENTTLASRRAYHLPSYIATDDSYTSATVGASLTLPNSSHLNLTYNYSDLGEGTEQIMLSYARPM